MRVGELKKMLAQVDDDLEVRVTKTEVQFLATTKRATKALTKAVEDMAREHGSAAAEAEGKSDA